MMIEVLGVVMWRRRSVFLLVFALTLGACTTHPTATPKQSPSPTPSESSPAPSPSSTDTTQPFPSLSSSIANVTGSFDVQGSALAAVYGFGSLWVTTWSGGVGTARLLRIDPATNAVVARIP